MKKTAKTILAMLLLAAMLLCSACGSAQPAPTAQPIAEDAAPAAEASAADDIAYPEKAITVICSWAAGGQADIVCRIYTDLLSKEFGQPIVVENITGTGGQVAAIEYMNAEPDGYTWIYSSDTIRFLAPRVSEVSYDPAQMVPLCTTASNGFGVIVNPASGVTNLEELKAYADANGPLTCAVTGRTGAITYELMNALFKELGIDAEFMVFDSGPIVANEVVGGNVDVGIAINPLDDQFTVEGSVNYIASFLGDGYEIEGYGKVASCVEQGVDLTCANPNMICVKAGTDQAIIDKIVAAMKAVQPEFEAKCLELGYSPCVKFDDELDSYLSELDALYLGMAESAAP